MNNLIANPGFESGTLSGWEVLGFVSLSNGAHSGSYALTGVGVIDRPALSQTFQMKPGFTRYLLSFWARSEFQSLCRIIVNAGALFDLTVRTTPDQVWRYYQKEIITFHTGRATIEIYFDQLTVIDDIYFAPIVPNLLTDGSFGERIRQRSGDGWKITGKGNWMILPTGGIQISGDQVRLEQEIDVNSQCLYETSILISINLAEQAKFGVTVGNGSFTYQTSLMLESGERSYKFRFFGQGQMNYQLTVEPGTATVVIREVQLNLVGTIEESTIPTTIDTVVDGNFRSLTNWHPKGSVSLSLEGVEMIESQLGEGISQNVPLISRRMTEVDVIAKVVVGRGGMYFRLGAGQEVFTELTNTFNTYTFPVIDNGSAPSFLFQAGGVIRINKVSTRSVLRVLELQGSYQGDYVVDFEAITFPYYGFKNPGLIYAYVNGALVEGANPIVVDNFGVEAESLNYKPYSFSVKILEPSDHFNLNFVINEGVVNYLRVRLRSV